MIIITVKEELKRKKKLLSKKGKPKRPWSPEETNAVHTFFRTEIKTCIVPGKVKCEQCIEKNKILASRNWKDVKYHVKNQISKISKFKKNI